MPSTEAYVLVQAVAEPGRISSALRAVPGVVIAEELRGPYDAIAFASSADGRPLERIIDDIRSLPHVTRAITAPVTATRSGAGAGRAA